MMSKNELSKNTLKQNKGRRGASHSSQLSRLKRIEGQVRGIQSMVEDRRYCMDIITQIKAVRAALASVEQKVVEEHLKHCVKQALDAKNKKLAEESIDEIMEMLRSQCR